MVVLRCACVDGQAGTLSSGVEKMVNRGEGLREPGWPAALSWEKDGLNEVGREKSPSRLELEQKDL